MRRISFGARTYNASIGRFDGVDPLASIARRFSPYVYANNNPLVFVDPNGMASEDYTYSDGYSTLSAKNSTGSVGFSGAYSNTSNPIYGTNGKFLGTDDKGLQGKAIVMNEGEFTQSMKHEDAMKKDLAPNGGEEFNKAIPNLDDYDSFYYHRKGLEKRPDYNGYLSKAEADAWWRGKSGEPLFVDQSQIELPGVTTKDFDNKQGSSFYKNFVWGLSNTGKVYGTLKLTLINASTGDVHLGLPYPKNMDKYDFTMDNRTFRNFATWVGRPGGANDGRDFLIYGYGNAKVPVKK